MSEDNGKISMDVPETISEAIGYDHRSFDICYEHIKESKTLDDKVKWRNQLTWTIARHAISEELTLYPAMIKYLGAKGKELTDTDFAQHSEVKVRLHELQDMSPEDEKFMPLLDDLMDHLHEHIEHESSEDMPALEGALPIGITHEIAKSFQRTKNIVPSRSHPAAPTEYYSENLAALMATPIDHIRNWFAGVEYPDEKDQAVARAEAVNRTLKETRGQELY